MAFTNNMFRLIDPFIAEVQDLETVWSDLRLKRSLEGALGTQLDNLGDILNLIRVTGQSDSDYRGDLKLQIAIHKSNGEAETIIKFVEEITNIVTVTAKFTDIPPARYRLTLIGPRADIIPTTRFFRELQQKIEAITAAGVGVDIQFQESTLSPFAFDDEGSEVTDGDGFLEAGFDEITGGYIAGAMVEGTNTLLTV